MNKNVEEAGLKLKIGRDILAPESPLRSKGSQPYIRAPRPRFQCQEQKSPKCLAIKTSGDCG